MLDQIVDTLFYPLRQEDPAWEEGDEVLVLGAREPLDMDLLPHRSTLVQPHRSFARALEERGLTVTLEEPTDQGRFAAAWVLPTSQRLAAVAEMARALLAVRPGGTVTTCVPNKLGAQRYEKAMGLLAGEVDTWSRRHCRVWRAARPDDLGPAREAAGQDAERPVLDGRFVSRPGLFSWDEVDTGSRVLAQAIPRDLGARVAELGCGWGWLADAILQRAQGLVELHLLESDHRALTLAGRNLAGAPVHLWWADATCEVPVDGLDSVVVNPPFHQAGIAMPEVGQAMLVHAARLLRPGGVLWAVANVHLPYERPLREVYGKVEVVAERSGFKVLRAERGAPSAAPTRPPPRRR